MAAADTGAEVKSAKSGLVTAAEGGGAAAGVLGAAAEKSEKAPQSVCSGIATCRPFEGAHHQNGNTGCPLSDVHPHKNGDSAHALVWLYAACTMERERDENS